MEIPHLVTAVPAFLIIAIGLTALLVSARRKAKDPESSGGKLPGLLLCGLGLALPTIVSFVGDGLTDLSDAFLADDTGTALVVIAVAIGKSFLAWAVAILLAWLVVEVIGLIRNIIRSRRDGKLSLG